MRWEKKGRNQKEKSDVSHVTTGNGKYNTPTYSYCTVQLHALHFYLFTIPLAELGVMAGSIPFHQQFFTAHRGFPLIHWPSFLLLAMLLSTTKCAFRRHINYLLLIRITSNNRNPSATGGGEGVNLGGMVGRIRTRLFIWVTNNI